MADRWWESAGWGPLYAPYAVLVGALLSGALAAAEFELLYLALFKTDDRLPQDEAFDVLDGLFADVDRYCEDDGLRARTGGIDEAELRARAKASDTRQQNGKLTVISGGSAG